MTTAGRTALASILAAFLLGAFLLGAPLPVLAQGQQPAAGSKVVYKPPLRGAPGGRVGGAARGTGREEFILSVLAPDHTGLTTREQPSLYWFISRPSSSPVELTVVDPDAADPLLELQLKPPIKAGVHRLNLADHNVRLKPGVAYQWYVSVVPDSGRRSKDILSGGSVERIDAPDDVKARVTGAAPPQLAAIYAEAGLWYDAVATLQDLLDASPKDAALVNQRAELLRSAGVPDLRGGE
jgi:hypothetical protein